MQFGEEAGIQTYELYYFFKDFIYLLLERGVGREKKREININVWEIHWPVASHMPPTGDLAYNPGNVPWLGIQPVTF